MPRPFWIDNHAALRHGSFICYLVLRASAVCAHQVIVVAIGWQAYSETGDAFVLGMIGLLQFIPALSLFLVTGTVADKYPRRAIVVACNVIALLCSLAMLGLISGDGLNLPLLYLVVGTLGLQRAFLNPAIQSLISNVVPLQELPGAIALVAGINKAMQIVGPVVGGGLYAVLPPLPYAAAAALFLASAVAAAFLRQLGAQAPSKSLQWRSATAGLRYIMRERVVLGAISLDLFTVLLGGTVALLPIFAKDILVLGPWALGLLRAAPAIGALAVSVYLAFRPLRRNAGRLMFISTAIFAAATLIFGLSTWPWLSVAALGVLGAADMISVVIRQTLIQVWTPDELRGRVNSVNQVFIGASNELGAFRAGVMASAVGTVPAVIIGGIGTLAVTALWIVTFPALRKVDRLDGDTGRTS